MLDSFITLAEASEGLNMAAEIAGKFGVRWDLITAQILNFALVSYVLYVFAFRPVLRTIEERQKKIADGLQYTEEMKEKLQEAEKEYADTMKKAAIEAKEMIDAAREQAKNYTEHQAQEAVAKAEATLKKAEEAIAMERSQMLADVRKEVAQLVITTSGKVLSKDLTPEERSRFSESAVKELSLN